jgi:hypothetical protein
MFNKNQVMAYRMINDIIYFFEKGMFALVSEKNTDESG